MRAFAFECVSFAADAVVVWCENFLLQFVHFSLRLPVCVCVFVYVPVCVCAMERCKMPLHKYAQCF